MISTSGDLFGRMVTAMVTPFTDELEIDYKAVEHLVEHLIKSGSDAILVAGTTGESPTLDATERSELLSFVLNVAAKRARVIMGTGSNDTKKSIINSQQAEALGADGLLVVAPYYNKPNQEGLKAHFAAIAQSTKLPLMLYNIPGRTGININPETILSLSSAYENITALKDSTGNVEAAQEIGRQANSQFHIYSGDDNLTLPYLSVGACGVVSVASHILGNEIKNMIDSYFQGKTDDARALHYLYLPLFKGLFIAPNPACVKYALSKLGICKAHLRLPLVPLSETEKSTMDALLKDVKIAAAGPA